MTPSIFWQSGYIRSIRMEPDILVTMFDIRIARAGFPQANNDRLELNSAHFE
jgi:hypothetical protein